MTNGMGRVLSFAHFPTIFTYPVDDKRSSNVNQIAS